MSSLTYPEAAFTHAGLYPKTAEVYKWTRDIEPEYVIHASSLGQALGKGFSTYLKGGIPVTGYTGRSLCKIVVSLFKEGAEREFPDLAVSVVNSRVLRVVEGEEPIPMHHTRLHFQREDEPLHTYDPTYRQTNPTHQELTLFDLASQDRTNYTILTEMVGFFHYPALLRRAIADLDLEADQQIQALESFDRLTALFGIN